MSKKDDPPLGDNTKKLLQEHITNLELQKHPSSLDVKSAKKQEEAHCSKISMASHSISQSDSSQKPAESKINIEQLQEDIQANLKQAKSSIMENRLCNSTRRSCLSAIKGENNNPANKPEKAEEVSFSSMQKPSIPVDTQTDKIPMEKKSSQDDTKMGGEKELSPMERKILLHKGITETNKKIPKEEAKDIEGKAKATGIHPVISKKEEQREHTPSSLKLEKQNTPTFSPPYSPNPDSVVKKDPSVQHNIPPMVSTKIPSPPTKEEIEILKKWKEFKKKEEEQSP